MIDPERIAMEQQVLHVDVHREDGSYWAEVRELPGCFASGDNAAELIESVEEAVALYLAPPEGEAAGGDRTLRVRPVARVGPAAASRVGLAVTVCGSVPHQPASSCSSRGRRNLPVRPSRLAGSTPFLANS